MNWQLLGLIGASLIVLDYWMLTTGRWSSSSTKYYIVNLVGAILLFISLLFNFNLGSIVIEGFWIFISVQGLIKHREAV